MKTVIIIYYWKTKQAKKYHMKFGVSAISGGCTLDLFNIWLKNVKATLINYYLCSGTQCIGKLLKVHTLAYILKAHADKIEATQKPSSLFTQTVGKKTCLSTVNIYLFVE